MKYRSALPHRIFAAVETLEKRRYLASIVPPSFTRIAIDANPGAAPLEKMLADIDGDHRLDAVVGFAVNPGAGGIFWYQNPHSGTATDTWQKYQIAPKNISSYEDIKAFSLEGDGIPDVIASFGGQVV
ncbi:MAG: VCBS repeat-containing protein, partial [Phycisphaerae bacterium]|nr:VCBS repeat-containing protein [Phycisphaerae bacterium]